MSKFSQCRYLLSCITKGFPHQLSLSRIRQQSDVVKESDSQILVNFLVTNVPRCIGCNSKTLALKHLQFPDMDASGGPPHKARIVLHRMDELLVQQNFIPDAETPSPIYERS